MLDGLESRSLASLAQGEAGGERGGGGRLSWCGIPPPSVGSSCSSSTGTDPQHSLSPPAPDIPAPTGSCQNSLLELLILLHISLSPRLGLSSRSCKSCKSLKRAADSLGVLLGMLILMETSPDPKFLPINERIDPGTAGAVWGQKKQSSKSNPALPLSTLDIPGFMAGKRWQQDGPAQTPIPNLFVADQQSLLLSLSFQRRETQQRCFKSKLKSQFVKFSFNKRFDWVPT